MPDRFRCGYPLNVWIKRDAMQMSANDPRRTSGRPAEASGAYFFTFDLVAGEPVWQALQGLPFAIWGVASAVHIASRVIAIDRTNTITAIAAVSLIVKRISSSGMLALTDVCSFGYSTAAWRTCHLYRLMIRSRAH